MQDNFEVCSIIIYMELFDGSVSGRIKKFKVLCDLMEGKNTGKSHMLLHPCTFTGSSQTVSVQLRSFTLEVTFLVGPL